MKAANKASRTAITAATAAGVVEGPAFLRIATKAQAPWLIGGAALAGAGLVATAALANHFGRDRTHSRPMSREDYTKYRLHDPKLQIAGHGASFAALGAGLVGGFALGGTAQYALAAASRPIQMLGIGAAMIGGMGGAMYGFDKARAALTN